MSADILPIILRATIAASAGIIAVLALRHPLRTTFGAEIAYGAWLLVPAVTLASFLPARLVILTAPPSSYAPPAAAAEAIAQAPASVPSNLIAAGDAFLSTIEPTPLLLGIWLAGVASSLFFLLHGQWRFMRNASAAGPAAVGIFNPRIVLPRDFEQRYTPEERDLVIAHERAHIAAFDVQINAIAAIAQCLNWFNPLFHIARAALRVDQELACDARVMTRRGVERRIYAEAMLKTQLAAQAVPLGCQWPPIGAQPLKQRIVMLARPRPNSVKIAIGAACCAAVTISAGALAWAAQEPRYVHAAQTSAEAVSPANRALGRDLVSALQDGQMIEARALIEAGADVNYYLRGDGTPLVIAARYGDSEMVALLVAHGADVNQAAPGDGNPLIMASMAGHIDIVRVLIENGADANGIVVDDETPLINAARHNRVEVARYLIEHGAEVNLAVRAMTVRGPEMRSPLGEARRRGHGEMIELLRANGATA